MPYYEYECERCGKVKEKFHPSIPRVIPEYIASHCCEMESTKHTRIMSTPAFHLKPGGVGWAEDGYGGQNPNKVVAFDEPS